MPSPSRFKLLARENQGTPFGRILDQRLFTVDFCQDEISPVFAFGDCRKRRTGQVAPLRVEHPSLQTKMLGRTQQLGVRNGLPRLNELVAQLRPISGKIVEAGHDEKTEQPCIYRHRVDGWLERILR